MLAPHYTLAVSWLGHREVTRAEVETGSEKLAQPGILEAEIWLEHGRKVTICNIYNHINNVLNVRHDIELVITTVQEI